MTSVPHSLRDLFAGHRTDVGWLVRAYVRLWLFDRWLGQIWRHIRRHVWLEFRVVGLRDRRRSHSGLLFEAQPMLGCVCSTSRELWRERLVL